MHVARVYLRASNSQVGYEQLRTLFGDAWSCNVYHYSAKTATCNVPEVYLVCQGLCCRSHEVVPADGCCYTDMSSRARSCSNAIIAYIHSAFGKAYRMRI